MDKNVIPWVKWEDVMAPRKAGGLCVRSIRDLNLALLSKWKWNFKTNPEALWVKVIKSIHHQLRKSSQFLCNKALMSVETYIGGGD